MNLPRGAICSISVHLRGAGNFKHVKGCDEPSRLAILITPGQGQGPNLFGPAQLKVAANGPPTGFGTRKSEAAPARLSESLVPG